MRNFRAEISMKRSRMPPRPPRPPKLVADRYLRELLVPPAESGMDAEFIRSSIIIGVIAETGIRLTELLSLRREDVDIQERQIRIRRRKASIGYRDVRSTPISASLAHRFRLSFEALRSADSLAVPNLPEWSDKSSPILQRAIAKAQLRRGLTAHSCGVEKINPNSAAFSFRDFRATAITTWVECGLPYHKVVLLAGLRLAWTDRPICLRSPILSAEERRFLEDRFAARYSGGAGPRDD